MVDAGAQSAVEDIADLRTVPIRIPQTRRMPVLSPQPNRQRWLALIALCVSVLAIMIQNTSINLALRSISQTFNTQTSTLQWVVDSYTMTFAGFMLAFGHIGDTWGRKKILTQGLILFAGISLVASYTNSIPMLIACQVGLGLTASLVFPTTLASINTIFKGTSQRSIAIAIWAAAAGMSAAVGPSIAGWFLEHFAWTSVYWINIIFAPLAVILVLLWVPETVEPHAVKFDTIGFMLSIVAITTLVGSIIQAPKFGWLSLKTILLAVVAIVLLIVFIAWEKHTPTPLIGTQMLPIKEFASSVVAIAVSFFALIGFLFVIAMYFQIVRGCGALESGLRIVPFAIFVGLSCPIAILVARKFSIRTTSITGLCLMACGFFITSFLGVNTKYSVLVLVMALLATGISFIQVPSTSAIMNAMPDALSGAGSAINDTIRELGGALGVAIMGSVSTTVFTSRVLHLIDQYHLPSEFRTSAQTSLTSLSAAVHKLPKQYADLAWEQGKEAYTAGICQASIVACVIVVIAAIVVRVMSARKQTNPV